MLILNTRERDSISEEEFSIWSVIIYRSSQEKEFYGQKWASDPREHTKKERKKEFGSLSPSEWMTMRMLSGGAEEGNGDEQMSRKDAKG